MNQIKSIFLMLIATIFWGTAFSAQSRGMQFVGPILFVMLRSLVTLTALSIIIIIADSIRNKKFSLISNNISGANYKILLYGGFWCGLALALASIFQQYGLLSAKVGKSGFITSLYIIIVPVLGIFFKRKTSFFLWIASILALLGTYLLCGGISGINKEDIFLLCCSLLFAFHIIITDHYAPSCNWLHLSRMQFASAAILSAVLSLLFREEWSWDKIMQSAPFWLFCGLGSGTVAFTLQIYAQKYLHPVSASLLMSFESVFAVIGGWLFLHEQMSKSEIIGCAIILMSIIIAQLPPFKFFRRKSK